jgi:hypothetical protein
MLCQLVEQKIKLPTWIVYGLQNVGVANMLQRTQTLAQNKEIPRIKIMLKPGRFYPTESKKCEIPTMLDSFSYEESPLFQIDGRELTGMPKKLVNLLNPILYESSSDEEA